MTLCRLGPLLRLESETIPADMVLLREHQRRHRRTHLRPEPGSTPERFSAEKPRNPCRSRRERTRPARSAAAATDSGVGAACAGLDNDSAGRRLPGAREWNPHGQTAAVVAVGCRTFRRMKADCLRFRNVPRDGRQGSGGIRVGRAAADVTTKRTRHESQSSRNARTHGPAGNHAG